VEAASSSEPHVEVTGVDGGDWAAGETEVPRDVPGVTELKTAVGGLERRAGLAWRVASLACRRRCATCLARVPPARWRRWPSTPWTDSVWLIRTSTKLCILRGLRRFGGMLVFGVRHRIL